MAKVLIVLVLTFLVSATVALPVQEELDWWQKTVIYQIYPRSYRDSDGNGVGDLRGIWQRVKPIKDAGAGAIWLSPIYESPMKDFGYDIINQTVIDPLFGNMEDFMDLMNITHELGLKLILDFVPDYSSDQHEWFQKSSEENRPVHRLLHLARWESRQRDGGEECSKQLGNFHNDRVSAFEGSAWSWNEDRQQYYYHVFTVEQPDLNYRNEFLVEDMKNVMRYWLDMGVDGFRVDSVPHLFEDTEFLDEPLSHDPNALEGDYDSLVHIYTQNLPETYDMVYQFRAVVDEYKAKDGVTRVMMTEAYETINQTMLYYGTDERPGAHFTFNFLFIRNLTENSTAEDYDYIIHQWMDNMPEGSEIRSTGFRPQVGNHDNHRAASRFPHLADAINMIAQLLPGTAVTYMGEEIAMEDTFISWEQTVDPPGLNAGPQRYQLFSRDPERTPYQWDNTTSAGETYLSIVIQHLACLSIELRVPGLIPGSAERKKIIADELTAGGWGLARRTWCRFVAGLLAGFRCSLLDCLLDFAARCCVGFGRGSPSAGHAASLRESRERTLALLSTNMDGDDDILDDDTLRSLCIRRRQLVMAIYSIIYALRRRRKCSALIGSPPEPAGNQTRKIARDNISRETSRITSGRTISDVIFQQRSLSSTPSKQSSNGSCTVYGGLN
uniref:alpha-glucosidase n=1 Tax=Timema tahoe TaxID=61484 RepID=A0A7R9I8X0_9NEOP|nr:unnamed protein product [Timema tahoe]